MINVLEIVNYGIVSLFGVLLTFSFLDIEFWKNWKYELIFAVETAGLQIISYLLGGYELAVKIYPFTVHIPLLIFVVFYGHKPWLISVTSVLISYLCCQPRKWIGMLFLSMSDSLLVYYIVQIVVSVPLLYFVLKYVAPVFTNLLTGSKKIIYLFGVIPFAYYVFDYMTTVYTNLLYEGSGAVVEFMPSLMAVMFVGFCMVYEYESVRRIKSELNCNYLEHQTAQAEKKLEELIHTEEQGAVFRHDMRHHLQMIKGYIENGNLEEAIAYINSADDEISAQKVRVYCQNVTLNLLLSYFAEQAEHEEISMTVRVDSPAILNISANDLCVILSNTLENAINECKTLPSVDKRFIRVYIYKKKENIFISIQNSSKCHISFKNGIPVTHEKGHGMGCKSIRMAVEKNGGICSFGLEEDCFTFRAML